MRYLTIIVLLVAFSCSEEPEAIPYNYTHVFTGDVRKGWTIRSYQLVEEGKGPITGRLDDCLSDDLYIFYANEERRMEVTDNSAKCSPDDPDLIAEGSWGFSNTGATLSMPFPLLADVPLPFIVREAEEDRMTLEIFFNENKSSYRFNFRSEELE